MFNNKNSLEAFKRALAVIAEEESALLPSAEECANITFSDDFRRKMQRLIKLQKRPYYALINTVSKRAACIIIAILLLFTTVTFSVKALREAAVEFFVLTFEKFSVIGVEEENVTRSITEIEAYCLPTYIPEGYELVKEEKSANILRLKFARGEEYVILSQQIIGDGDRYIDTEDAEVKEVYVNSYKGYLVKKDTAKVLYWNDDVYSFITMATDMDEAEILRFAESVKRE